MGCVADSSAILANTDPWFFLNKAKINGVYYEIEHDEVIRRLRVWDALYGLQIIGSGMDWLYPEFEKPLQNLAAFADEVYESCPDAVDRGTGSTEALAVQS